MPLTTAQQATINHHIAQHKYYTTHKEAVKLQVTTWKENNKDYIREYNKAYMRHYRAKKRLENKKTSGVKPRGKLLQEDSVFKDNIAMLEENKENLAVLDIEEILAF